MKLRAHVYIQLRFQGVLPQEIFEGIDELLDSVARTLAGHAYEQLYFDGFAEQDWYVEVWSENPSRHRTGGRPESRGASPSGCP